MIIITSHTSLVFFHYQQIETKSHPCAYLIYERATLVHVHSYTNKIKYTENIKQPNVQKKTQKLRTNANNKSHRKWILDRNKERKKVQKKNCRLAYIF